VFDWNGQLVIRVRQEDYHGDRDEGFRPPGLRVRAPRQDIAGDLLPALAISKAAFAAHLGISRNTLYKLLNEEQPVTLELALRLDKALGNGADPSAIASAGATLARADATPLSRPHLSRRHRLSTHPAPHAPLTNTRAH
jgi:addiction module HigA family antidote